MRLKLSQTWIFFVLMLAASWAVIKLSIIYNKRNITKHKICLDLSEQILDENIAKNKISKRVFTDLYQLIEKHFKIKMCLLRPNDTIKYFYDMDTFKLGENTEEFEKEFEKMYNIKPEEIDINGNLLDLMIKMQKRREKK
jgi:hypothetical protein